MQVLFDSGRFPLWFRIPALLFGLFALWFGASLAAYSLTGFQLGFPGEPGSGSPLLGSLAALLIATLWIFVWFAQFRFLFDADRQELIRRTRGFLRWHEERVSTAGASDFQIDEVRSGMTIHKWIILIKSQNRSERFAEIAAGVEELGRAIAAATKLPVVITPRNGAATRIS
jgi:hypothetical protein